MQEQWAKMTKLLAPADPQSDCEVEWRNRPSPAKGRSALRVAPGLRNLLEYRREWLRHDAVAGVSVAAVALPTAIAYAELIGFDPVVGLYAAILPMLVYAIFGTSRHLIVNPDAATCAMVGATLMPLTAGHSNSLMSLSIALAVFTGILCILAGFLRLGFVADFLAKPILVGFLNGVAIHIFLGQIGKVFGFSMKSHGIIPSLLEFVQKLPQTHLPTLAVGVLTIGVMLAGKRWLPRWPAPLLAVVFAVALVQSMGLDGKGVTVVGPVPSGLPRLRWPEFDPELVIPLLGGALGVALLSFSNAIVVARSFAAKGRYEVDADQELIALGACQIAAGFSQGFADQWSRFPHGDELLGGGQKPGCRAGGSRNDGCGAGVSHRPAKLSAQGGAWSGAHRRSHRALRRSGNATALEN